MASTPTRIEDELYEQAKLVGGLMSRSAAQQIAHWARVGREIEADDAVSHRAVAEVLASRRRYDQVNEKEQAIVRAEWAARMEARRETLDLTQRFAEEGRTYVELDDEGQVVERDGASTGRPSTA